MGVILITPQSAADLLAPYFAAREGEAVAVLHLDSEFRLIATTFSQAGAADGVDLPVRDILAAALRMGAAAIIIAHNHPSGDPAPSEEDLRATRRLADAASAAGIRLADHLVVAGGDWRSFRELGLL
jgi:DNA repair protein RadC